jgi:threonine/homoserine/homoserine lactone efflux protein
LAGAIAGGVVFALFVGLGLTMLNRVDNDLPVIILGVAGAYAGWLVGVIVFGSVRGTNNQTDETERKDQEEQS